MGHGVLSCWEFRNHIHTCATHDHDTTGLPAPMLHLNKDSYANLNTEKKFLVKGHQVNNWWVVPYPCFWLWKFCCHINMKCILLIKAIKYIVYKGHDHTTMEFGWCQDEIKLYLDSRYVSACEGLWRLYQFLMHEHCPTLSLSSKPAANHMEQRQCPKCTGHGWGARKQGHHSHCLLQSQCWISSHITTPLPRLSLKICLKGKE